MSRLEEEKPKKQNRKGKGLWPKLTRSASDRGKKTKKRRGNKDAMQLTDKQKGKIKAGRRKRRASIGGQTEEKYDDVDAPVDEASLYGQWLDENFLVNEDGSAVLVPLDSTEIGTLRKFGQRPLNDSECEEIKGDALVTPTVSLHPAVLVTFKYSVKQVRRILHTVISSPRKHTHQLPYQRETDNAQSFVCVQLELLRKILWGVAGKQHQTEGIKRAALANARVRALRRLIPGSLYALLGMTAEQQLKAVSFLVNRSQKVDNMNRHTSSIDRHSATRDVIVGKFHPECPVRLQPPTMNICLVSLNAFSSLSTICCACIGKNNKS